MRDIPTGVGMMIYMNSTTALATFVDPAILAMLDEKEIAYFEKDMGVYPNAVILAVINDVIKDKTKTKTVARKEDLKHVVRKYRCRECGYLHEDGVDVTLEGFNEETGKFDNSGWWTCDECGEQFVNKVQITSNDLK